MVAEDKRAKENRRKGTERRKSSILSYELLNLNSPDKRNEPNRRRVRDRRIK